MPDVSVRCNIMLQNISVLKNLRYSMSSFICRNNSHESKFRSSLSSKMMPVLYGDEASPPTRFVLITAQLLGVDLNFHMIDLFQGENKTAFYQKINPLQKVPALSTNGQIICDSHAIALHICRISKSQDLYSANYETRSKVDQMLYFDATTLFPVDSAILSEYFAGKWPADEIKVDQWYSAMDYLEAQLNMNEWLAGDKMQLCDICCATTLSSLGILLPPLGRHVKIKQWQKKLQNEDCFEINTRGLQRLQFFIKRYGPALDNNV